jgi:hypothetical protein
MISSSKSSTISAVLPLYLSLLKKVEGQISMLETRLEDESSSDRLFSASLLNATKALHVKLEKYWDITGESELIHYASMVLHPGFNQQYFGEDTYQPAVAVESEFEEEFKKYAGKHFDMLYPEDDEVQENTINETGVDLPPSSDVGGGGSLDDDIYGLPQFPVCTELESRNVRRLRFINEKIVSELNHYKRQSPVTEKRGKKHSRLRDPLPWWKNIGAAQYPIVAAMARDYLAIQGMHFSSDD